MNQEIKNAFDYALLARAAYAASVGWAFCPAYCL